MDEHDFVTCANVKIQIKESNKIENPNKCRKCDYSFSHAGDLRRHSKMHSGEKTHKCNQCDFASSYASALKGHLKTHSGEK